MKLAILTLNKDKKKTQSRSKGNQSKTLTPTGTTFLDEKAYRSLFNKFIRDFNKFNKHMIFKAIEDKSILNPEHVNKMFYQMDEKSKDLINHYFPYMVKVLKSIDDKNVRVLNSKLTKKFGIELGDVLKQSKLQESFKFAVEQNFNLIKRLTGDQLSRVKTNILQDLQQGEFSAVKLKEDLQKTFGISERHAKFIATDQSHKLSATLNMLRYQQLGVTKYIWRTRKDTHVRGNPAGPYSKAKYSHWAREGKIYYFDKPPADGNAGMPPGCRCEAEPIFDFLEKE